MEMTILGLFNAATVTVRVNDQASCTEVQLCATMQRLIVKAYETSVVCFRVDYSQS